MSELKILIRNRIKCCAKSGAAGDCLLWKNTLDRIEKLESGLNDLSRLASECDGWESFPQQALDDAHNLFNE